MGQRYSGESPFWRTRQAIAGAVPGAGADWTVTVPAGQLWRIRSIYARLVTSATVANRVPVLSVALGGAVIYRAPAPVLMTANSTWDAAWLPGVGNGGVSFGAQAAIPELLLGAGSVISVTTANIDPADQWSAPQVYADVTEVRGGDADLDSAPDMSVVVISAPSE